MSQESRKKNIIITIRDKVMESQLGSPIFFSFRVGMSSKMAIIAATSKGMIKFFPK
jgi:hypothetical protein